MIGVVFLMNITLIKIDLPINFNTSWVGGFGYNLNYSFDKKYYYDAISSNLCIITTGKS